MQINVTQEDIDKGVHGSASSCPVALAIKRRIKGQEVWVNRDNILIQKKNPWWKAWLGSPYTLTQLSAPNQVGKFIINYESYKDPSIIKPFSFELPI